MVRLPNTIFGGLFYYLFFSGGGVEYEKEPIYQIAVLAVGCNDDDVVHAS